MAEVELASSDIWQVSVRDLSTSGLRVQDLSIRDASFHSVEFSGGVLRGVRAVRSQVRAWRANGASIQGAVLRDCDLDDLSHVDGPVRDLVANDCRIDGPVAVTDLEGLDGSRSRFSEIDVSGLGLSSAALLNASFSRCTWPEFNLRASVTGKPLVPPGLPAQPIQDVQGVPPVVRRSIADAQYLRARFASAETPVTRLGLRLWGATSTFGQSLARLTMVAGCSAAVLVVVGLAERGKLLGSRVNPPLIWEECRRVGLTGLGAGNVVSLGDSWTMLGARILGLLALGVWIGIAANRLGRLGSE